MISLPRRVLPLVVLAGTLVASLLSACSAQTASTTTLALAAVFPASGADAAVGAAMRRGVELAVRQHHALGKGYTLTLTQTDSADGDMVAQATALASDKRIMGIVGPIESQSAAQMLSVTAQRGILMLSPGATLPGLTRADAARAEGLDAALLHPKGKAASFLRLAPTDVALGKAAADLAIAPRAAHGFAARSVFVVDDTTPSALAQVAAFTQELAAQHGTLSGQQSLVPGATTGMKGSAQAVVTAIIEADPSLVFFAGETAAGAALRGTLSLTGAPGLPILATGQIADNPTWGETVAQPAAEAQTVAILPAPDLASNGSASAFVAAYHSAYPKDALLPQSALAYDAAMDEITTMQALITAGKPVTRAAVLAGVASATYHGVTGTLAFDANRDPKTPLALSLYRCDAAGDWHLIAPALPQ